MKPPADLPSVLIASGEAIARRFGIEPPLLWDYLYRRKAPPAEVRAALVEAFFPRVRPDDFLLTSPDPHSTLNTVDTTANNLRSWAKLSDDNRKHPAVKIWAKLNITTAEVAAALTERLGRKVPRSTVQAWYKQPTSDDYRPIPADAADACLALWKIPRTAWNRITPAV